MIRVFTQVSGEPGPGHNESPELKLQKGDVLLVKDGNTLGITNVVAQLPRAATVNGSIAILRATRAEPRFLRYTLASHLLQSMIGALKAGMGVPHLFQADIKKFPLPLPPPPTQRAIADYLDRETARIDALIAAKRRTVVLLEERVRHIAYDLTTTGGKFVPLRRLVQAVKTGTTPPVEEFARLSDGTVPWYSPGDVGEWLVLSEPGRTLKTDAIVAGWVPQFPPDSTLLVGIGATAGKIAFLDHAASGNQQITCLVPGPRLIPRFLSWQLLARRDEVRATAPFTTLPIINNEFVRSLPILVPEIPEQIERVSRLDDAAAKVQTFSERAERQVALLREHRQALITAAVTGQLALREAA